MEADEGSHQQWALPNTEVYHTERYGKGQGFTYAIPLKEDGLYTLVLKFSEIFFGEPGQKVFDVKLGQSTIIRDLDIFGKLLSRGIPFDEFVEFTIKDGRVFIGGSEATGALKNGKLQINFAQGRADNPKVNGIVIVEGGKQNTHFEAHKKYLKALDDIKKQQQKQHQEEETAMLKQVSSFDYFSDDEDPSVPKTPINAVISKPYLLEACSLGFLAFFFFVVNVVLGDNTHKK